MQLPKYIIQNISLVLENAEHHVKIKLKQNDLSGVVGA